MEYRRLEKGEIIQAGDEFDNCVDAWRDNPIWVPVPQHIIGTPASDPAYVAHTAYRRPATLAADTCTACGHPLVDGVCNQFGCAQWQVRH